jgi:hypothetical protein
MSIFTAILYQIEEGDTFVDEMDEDDVSEVGPQSSVSGSDSESSDEDILAEDEDNINNHTEVLEKAKNLIVPNTQESSVTKVTMPTSDTKSKNAKPNPKSRLNVG